MDISLPQKVMKEHLFILRHLEHSAKLRILYFVFRNGKSTRGQLKKGLKAHPRTIRKALRELMWMRLIVVISEHEYPYRIWTELTHEGNRVAWNLSEILTIMTSNKPEGFWHP